MVINPLSIDIPMGSYLRIGHHKAYTSIHHVLIVVLYILYGSGRGREIRWFKHQTSGYTSSTAQGGSGSFKNKKPIGEVGCCESRMAERIH